MTSAKEIVSLNPQLIKIPSACNLNKKMLEYLCNSYSGEVHLSFRMTSHEEEEKIVSLFESKGKNGNFVITVVKRRLCLLFHQCSGRNKEHRRHHHPTKLKEEKAPYANLSIKLIDSRNTPNSTAGTAETRN